jgi:hypothetical protein
MCPYTSETPEKKSVAVVFRSKDAIAFNDPDEVAQCVISLRVLVVVRN